jgi:hypothetical protein
MFINNYVFSMVNRREIELSEFDFMLVRYMWGAGSGNDLDTSTGILNTGTSIDNTYVGFQQTSGSTQEFVPSGTTSSSAYLWYALDNTSGEGVEAIVLGVNNIKNGVTTLFNKIQFPIMAHWWSSRGTGNIQIELTTYKDGYMGKTGTNIVNVGGTLVSTNTLSVNVIQMASSSVLLPSFQHIATVDYDILLDKAVIKPHGIPSTFTFSNSNGSGIAACAIGSYPNTWYSYDSEILGTGSVVFSTNALNTTITGSSSWYKESGSNNSYQIDNNGNILGVYNCSGAPTSSMWTIDSYTDPNLTFTQNYGSDTSVTFQTSTNSGSTWGDSTGTSVSPRNVGSHPGGTWMRLKSTSDFSVSNVLIVPGSPPSTLEINATVLSLGTGHIDITGGEPGERIYLTLTLTFNDSFFSTLSITSPTVIAPVDTIHDSRTGYVDLDASGNATSTYTVDPSDATFNSSLDMTSRSSGLPMPATTSVGISNT